MNDRLGSNNLHEFYDNVKMCVHSTSQVPNAACPTVRGMIEKSPIAEGVFHLFAEAYIWHF